MQVLVNGIGNIGKTVLGVLARFQRELGITQIYALKNTIQPWNQIDLVQLAKLGITVCTRDGALGYTDISQVIDAIDYIFDCNANHIGMQNKPWYTSLPQLQGCSSQGSEKGFGIPFMSGINDDTLQGQRYAQIVSCNTHALASLLSAFCGGPDLPHLAQADFVVVRRSEDLGQHERLVSANVVSRHISDLQGTHHAIDVFDLFQTTGLAPQLTSSDITTPSQLMHGVRFNIQFKNAHQPAALDCIAAAPMLAGTHKFDSNIIFEQGRRYGYMGRLYEHAIVVDNNLLQDEHSLKGWAFIPQEGCTILSTVHAYLLQTGQSEVDKCMLMLFAALLTPRW